MLNVMRYDIIQTIMTIRSSSYLCFYVCPHTAVAVYLHTYNRRVYDTYGLRCFDDIYNTNDTADFSRSVLTTHLFSSRSSTAVNERKHLVTAAAGVPLYTAGDGGNIHHAGMSAYRTVFATTLSPSTCLPLHPMVYLLLLPACSCGSMTTANATSTRFFDRPAPPQSGPNNCLDEAVSRHQLTPRSLRAFGAQAPAITFSQTLSFAVVAVAVLPAAELALLGLLLLLCYDGGPRWGTPGYIHGVSDFRTLNSLRLCAFAADCYSVVGAGHPQGSGARFTTLSVSVSLASLHW